MYLLKDTNRQDFNGINVPKQQDIINHFGSPLIPEEAFDLIKQHTEDFKKSDPLAKEADKLLYELLQSQTKKETSEIKSKTPKILDQEAIQIRANARERRLRLLQFKLKLTQKSA